MRGKEERKEERKKEERKERARGSPSIVETDSHNRQPLIENSYISGRGGSQNYRFKVYSESIKFETGPETFQSTHPSYFRES